MAIITRVAKGSELTYDEMDNNFLELDKQVGGYIAGVSASDTIVSGWQLASIVFSQELQDYYDANSVSSQLILGQLSYIGYFEIDVDVYTRQETNLTLILKDDGKGGMFCEFANNRNHYDNASNTMDIDSSSNILPSTISLSGFSVGDTLYIAIEDGMSYQISSFNYINVTGSPLFNFTKINTRII